MFGLGFTSVNEHAFEFTADVVATRQQISAKIKSVAGRDSLVCHGLACFLSGFGFTEKFLSDLFVMGLFCQLFFKVNGGDFGVVFCLVNDFVIVPCKCNLILGLTLCPFVIHNFNALTDVFKVIVCEAKFFVFVDKQFLVCLLEVVLGLDVRLVKGIVAKIHLSLFLFKLLFALTEGFGSTFKFLSSSAEGFFSLTVVKLFLLDFAVRHKASVDGVFDLGDFLLTEFVVFGALVQLADVEKMLVEFFCVGLFVFGLVLGRGFHSDVFVHFFFDFDFLFDFDFNLFLFDFHFGLFGRSGRLFGFFFLVGFVLLFLFKFLSKLVALDFVLCKIEVANSQKVGELSVVKVHIRLVLIIQTLKEHCVQSDHLTELLLRFRFNLDIFDIITG